MPAQAHLATQLFQGAEVFESGVIRAPLPELGLTRRAKLPNGLYQIPPEFKLNVELRSGARRGQVVSIPHILYGNPSVDVMPAAGERVLVSEVRLANGQMLYRIIDYDRRPILLGFTLLTLAALLVIGRGFGLKTVLLTVGSGALLYLVALPLVMQGHFPLLVMGLVAVVLTVAGTRMMLTCGSAESKAAIAGGLAGLGAVVLALLATYHLGHVTGLSSPDALVLQAHVSDARRLNFRLIWSAGALVTTLGGLIAMSGLTARAIAQRPHEDPWTVGWQEQRALMPVLSLGVGLLYLGISLPLLLISHLDEVTSIRIAWPRFFNFEYLASLILAWESSIIGLLVAAAVTAWTARRLRKQDS